MNVREKKETKQTNISTFYYQYRTSILDSCVYTRFKNKHNQGEEKDKKKRNEY